MSSVFSYCVVRRNDKYPDSQTATTTTKEQRLIMGEPMEIDPVDDGPTKMSVPPPPPPPSVASANVQPIVVTEEDEARQAIEILRGDDVAARVSAANKLEAVAAALGEQRTREVRERERDAKIYTRERMHSKKPTFPNTTNRSFCRS